VPTTSNYGLRYPQGTDTPNIAQYFQNLANDVDNALPQDWVQDSANTSFNYVAAVGATWTDVTGMTFTSPVIPPGRTFEVEWKAPALIVAGGYLYVRLLINNAEQDTNTASHGAQLTIPGRLTGSYVGTNATVVFKIQAQLSAGSGSIAATGGGAVRMRHRII